MIGAVVAGLLMLVGHTQLGWILIQIALRFSPDKPSSKALLLENLRLTPRRWYTQLDYNFHDHLNLWISIPQVVFLIGYTLIIPFGQIRSVSDEGAVAQFLIAIMVTLELASFVFHVTAWWNPRRRGS